MRILFVEDDEDLGEIVKYNLEKENFEVDWVLDGKEALEKSLSGNYDLIILDIMLPGIDGKEICKLLRDNEKTKDVPIIMLTALCDEDTKVESFGYGADDYVTKPFSMKELIARIGAINRRLKLSENEKLAFKGITLDKISKEITVDGQPVQLTKTEYQLIELFLSNPNKVFSREELLEKIWGKEHSENTRTLDVYISRLRKKLGSYGKYLRTLPRLGYKLTAEEK
ncbi:response regulator transcription factor [Desulfurobacterium sp.]